jgi:AcrR family transcriptional regulator
VPGKKFDFTPEPTKKPRRVLNRDDWIDLATGILVSKSVDSIHPAALATDLGVTIGSFYYHFKDRNDLLVSVLKKWHERTTTQVVRAYGEAPLEQALAGLLSLPAHGATARRAAMVEFAIRAWARRDDMAREAVKQVDQQRIDLFAAAFRKGGFARAEAQSRAFLVYSYLLSEAILWEVTDAKARKRQLAFAKKLLLMPLQG